MPNNIDMTWIWMILFLFFAVFEFITPGNLITIWFALGALGALIAQQLGLHVLLQGLIFVLVSFGTLILVRPFTKNLLRGDTVATNYDRIIGQQFRLDKDYDPKVWYQQSVNSEVWSIINASRNPLKMNTLVEIISIDGVKLVVKEIKEKENE